MGSQNTRGQKRFVDTLTDLRNGDLQQDLTDALKEVVGRVLETGKAGKLVLTIKVRKASKGAGTSLVLVDDVKTTLPVPERGESVLFATEDLTLQRNDPRQPRLTDLDQPVVNIKEVRGEVNG